MRIGSVLLLFLGVVGGATSSAQAQAREIRVTDSSVSIGEDLSYPRDVWLVSAPTDTVVVDVTPQDGTQLTMSPARLTFTPTNWNRRQVLNVTPLDDDIHTMASRRTSVTLTAGTAEPGDFSPLAGITIAGGPKSGTGTISTTDDDDTPALVILPRSLSMAEGDSGSYTVKLATEPSADVTVAVTGHSGTDLTLDKTSLTFSTSNWSQVQRVTVSAGEDDDASSDIEILRHAASGGGYDGLRGSIGVKVRDDDTPALVILPRSLSMAEGDSGSYTVKLATEPSADVTVAVTGHSGTDLTLDKTSLTFSASNWSQVQRVTVSAGEDDDASSDIEILRHAASGGGYDGLRGSIGVKVRDDDTPALVILPRSLSMAEGDSGSYTVKLATEPSADVTVAVTGHSGTDLTLDKTSLTFSASNWSQVQRVTVSAGEDDDASSDIEILRHAASGGGYDGLRGSIGVKVRDDDTPALVILPRSLSMAEGDSGSYTVKLATEPSADVTVAVTGHSGTDLTLDKTSLTFSASNWSQVQRVTVSAGEDDDASSDIEILRHAASGGGYDGLRGSIGVKVRDDDTPALVILPRSLSMAEGDSGSYTVKLATEPSADVTVAVTGHSGTDLTLDKTSLTFSTSNWSQVQRVTVSAGEDDDASSDIEILRHAASGGGYDGLRGSIGVKVRDDDTPALVILPRSLSMAEGDSGSYTVKLATEPSADVTVAVTGHSGTDLTLDKTSLTFSTSNWSQVQRVTVSAGEDDDASNDAATLVHTASGGGYDSETASVVVTVRDNDEATVPVPMVSLSVAPNPVDEGSSVTVTAQLSAAISSSVTIPLTLTAGTAESGDYGALASITVGGGQTTGTGAITTAQDADEDDETFTVALGILPPEVTPGSPSSVEVTIRDDDRPPPPPANRPPTVTASCDPCVVARGGDVRLTATASDPDGDPLTYGWSAAWGGFAGSVDESAAVWTAPAETGRFEVRIEVSDGRGGSASAEVEVEVVNDRPVFEEPSYGFELPENLDGRRRPVELGAVTAEDPDGDELTYGMVFGDSERFAVGARDGVVSYIGPGEDYETEPNRFALTVRVRDDFGADDAARVVVEVTDVNEFPEVTASCDPCTVARGGEVRLEAKATDPDGDPLTYGWRAPTGSFSGANEAIARWTASAEPGRVTIRVEVADGRGGSAAATVTVEVFNRPPAFEQPSYGFELPENLDGRERPVELGAMTAGDPDGDELTYGIVSGDRDRFAVGARDGVMRYVGPGEDFETEPSLYELTVRARDAFGAETRAGVAVTVTDVNELPEVTASCDPCAVARGGGVRLEAKATDPDGDRLTYVWSARKGSFAGPVDIPVAQWRAPADTGRVEIRVEVSDGRGGLASTAVTVEVFNRPPTFEQPSWGFGLPENVDGRERPADLGRVAAEDPDGDALTYELVSGDRERFAVGARDGAVRYVGPGEDFETAPNRFDLTVRARDEFGGEARTDVAVEVTDVNEAPEAADDEAVTPEDEAVTVDVLANDTDPEGNRLRVQTVSAATHGTTRLAAGGRVTYMPEADFHGLDSFTYVASDGRGLTDTASVEVTVLPVNDAPTAVGSIPDQVLDEGGGGVRVGLSPFFGDVDGDALTYRARSSDTGVVLAEVAGAVLTLTPVVYGSATVTVAAEDPAGLGATQSVRVGVSDRPQRAILGNVLAATARGHLASLRAALGRRLAAGPCEASRLAVMGRSVPLGRTEAATMLGQLGAGARSAAAAALGLGEGAGERVGAMRLSAGPGAPTALAAETVSERADRLEAALRPVPARALGIGGGSGSGAADFLLGWGGPDRDGERCPPRGRWSLWGQGDVQRFEGTPSVHDSGYDGELSTAYLGLDTRLGGRWLAGVALSRSKGAGDWRAGSSEGRLTQTMTAIHPYLRWTGGSTSVWASVGAGRGDARNVRAAGKLGTSATDLRLGLVELERRLGAPGGLDVGIVGDAAWARLRTGEGEETIDGQDIAVNQVRLGADLSLPARLGGADLTPFGTVYARRDGGAGQTGNGIEVAGGLRAVLGIVRLDAQARMLAHHSAEGYGERGAALTLALRPRGGDGLSLSVSPRWGDPARATGAFLHGPLGGNLRLGEQGSDRWTLDARANYGVDLPGGLRLDVQGSYGGASGGPGFSLRVGMSGNSRGNAGG